MTTSKVIKYLFFAFNFFFFVAGIIIFSLSIHAKNKKVEYQISDEALPAINLLIFVSAVTLIFGFLGYCGTIRESRFLLALFFVGLLLMFLMMLAVGALGAISRTPAAQEVVKGNMKQLLPLSEQPKKIQELLQKVEITGFCCGLFVGHLDWGNSSVVPDSCNCTDTSKNCTDLGSREVYSTPCMTYIMTWLDQVSDSLMGTAFAFGILMILGMSFALVLLCQFKRSENSIM
ncbi:hypothetical protein PAMP_002667 [Pampus punctatissimus]